MKLEKDKLKKRRHYYLYNQAIKALGLQNQYEEYVFMCKHRSLRKGKKFISDRRMQRAFCQIKGIKLKNTVFDLSHITEEPTI